MSGEASGGLKALLQNAAYKGMKMATCWREGNEISSRKEGEDGEEYL